MYISFVPIELHLYQIMLCILAFSTLSGHPSL